MLDEDLESSCALPGKQQVLTVSELVALVREQDRDPRVQTWLVLGGQGVQ